MKIIVKTFYKTERPVLEVFEQFNKEMFYYLTKNAPVTPLRYDGDEVGSEVHLDMKFPWKDKWISVITDRNIHDTRCYFIDEGKVLPFKIKKWKHHHIIHKAEGGVIIEDFIYFEAGNFLLNIFWWFAFIPQFIARKSQYKKYLNAQFSDTK